MSDIEITGVPAESFLNFCIRVLKNCEQTKLWVQSPGRYINTCGYTGPGIGLVISILESHGVNDETSFERFLNNINFNRKRFCNVVNEVIGNLLDLSSYCPITDVEEGVCGLIRQEKTYMDTEEEPDINELRNNVEMAGTNPFGIYGTTPTRKDFSVIPRPRFNLQRHGRDIGPAPRSEMEPQFPETERKIYMVLGRESLKPGVNILSFSREKYEWGTFHHATIYTIPDRNVCYIIDSWIATCHITGNLEWRRLTVRRFTYNEVIRCIEEIHSPDTTIERRFELMSKYFLAHPSLLPRLEISPHITIFTTNPYYLEYIYRVAFMREEDNPNTSSFGGRLKRNKNTKRRSSSKNTNKRKKHSHLKKTKRKI
jgi:hypothetical protein